MESGEELLQKLRAAYDADRDNLEAVSRLAEHYCGLGWYNEAIDLYRAALERHPDDYALRLEFGNVQFRRGDRRDAVDTFTKLTQAKPERIEGWNNLGIVQLAMGESASAGTSFARVLEIEPDHPGALLNMGNFHSNSKDYPKARELFERAVAARPDFADAWFNLGNTYLALEEYAKAKPALEKALRQNREFPSALKNLGFACEKLGELDNALEFYGQAARVSKADASLQVNLANVYLLRNRYDEAKKCFLKAVRLAPKSTAGWMGLRHLALLKGDVGTFVRATMAILPRLDDVVVAGTIETLCELNHFKEAQEILEQADRLNKTCDELDAQRMLLYQRASDNPGKVLAIYRRLSSLPSAADPIRKSLARYQLATGAFEAAIEQIRRMADPGSSGSAVLWRALIGKGDLKLAEAAIAGYLRENPDCFEGYFLLAKIMAGRGDKAAARENLVRALENGFTSVEEIQTEPVLKAIFESLTKQRKDAGGVAG